MDRQITIECLKEIWLPEGDLPWLNTLSDEALEGLYNEVRAHTERVDRAQAAVYRAMASATRFVPKFAVAKLATSVDPYVVAQITRQMESPAAAAVSRHLDPAFLGDVALHLDTGKTTEIVRHSDVDRVTLVVERMGDRGMHHRLGELADALDTPLLNRLVNKLGDADRVASIAAEMSDHDKLRDVARALKPKLAERIVRALLSRDNEQAAVAAHTLQAARA